MQSDQLFLQLALNPLRFELTLPTGATYTVLLTRAAGQGLMLTFMGLPELQGDLEPVLAAAIRQAPAAAPAPATSAASAPAAEMTPFRACIPIDWRLLN